MIKQFFQTIIRFLFGEGKQTQENSSQHELLERMYDTGKKLIPFITFAKGGMSEYEKGYIFPSHYCNDDRLPILLDFCDKNNISVENHGKHLKTNRYGSTKEWNYVSLYINDKYISGQCFHRVLTTALENNNI